MAAPFEQYTKKEGTVVPVSSGAPFEQYMKPEQQAIQQPADNIPKSIDIPPDNAPADWNSPQQKAIRRQAYLLSQQNKKPIDTWTDKVRAGIEAGGGTAASIVASIPGIPYGLYNAIANKVGGKPADTENEIIKGIQELNPDFLMPKTDLGKEYQENIGTALQGMPMIGPEGSVIASVPQLAAQFAKAKMGAMAQQAKVASGLVKIKPLTKISQSSGLDVTNPELHAKISAAENEGTINPVVARRHIEADSLPEVQDEEGNPLKIRLTKGMATQDSQILSDEKNTRASNPAIREVIDNNGKAMPLVIKKFQQMVAPDIDFRNAPEEGQYHIDKLDFINQKLMENTRQAYNDLHNVAEESGLGNTPLDANAFSKDVEQRFKGLGMYHEDLPAWTKRRVEEIASGDYPLTFKNFEQFRSDLAMEQRDLAKSNASGASRSLKGVNEIRDALENMPLTSDAQILKPLADKARATAKVNFDLQKQVPAYKAVVDGTARPDDFVNKYILGDNKNTGVNQVRNLLNMFPDDKEYHQALAYAALNDIYGKSVNSKGQLSSAKLFDALKKGQDSGKHELLLQPHIMDGLQKLNNTAQLVQGAPAGNYIQGNPHLINSASNLINSMAYKALSKVPVIGPDIAGMKQRFRERKFATESTQTGAGLDYNPNKPEPKEPLSKRAFKAAGLEAQPDASGYGTFYVPPVGQAEND